MKITPCYFVLREDEHAISVDLHFHTQALASDGPFQTSNGFSTRADSVHNRHGTRHVRYWHAWRRTSSEIFYRSGLMSAVGQAAAAFPKRTGLIQTGG
jgi:hypothetical protein